LPDLVRAHNPDLDISTRIGSASSRWVSQQRLLSPPVWLNSTGASWCSGRGQPAHWDVTTEKHLTPCSPEREIAFVQCGSPPHTVPSNDTVLELDWQTVGLAQNPCCDYDFTNDHKP